ncbi:hypothetical protein A3770_16p78690 [Chloropicon primus]|uniref:Uncharacterized protein n=1 Tax=Chloropicon primus TaxID=1764295 RepID=A0A5B8MY77_9CHLO|nr:hypothetical protein A3770_16p78690 [Chloropicon primus]|eukprot:QDZ25351.1 hypothetical protein A3770_16p78690 [Chloropicon primus]
MATKKGRPRGAFWVNQGGVPLIFATLLAFSSFVQVQAICPSTPENCGSQNQFCGALPSFGTGKYRAGCTWNNVTDIYCPTSCDNDPDNPDCNPNPPIEDCEYVWHIDSNEGYEASCSNKPTYSSYTGHGGLSNSCPYACTYETGDGFCTDAVTPPSVNLGFADGFGGDENVALIVQYGQGTPPDFKKVAFVHKRRFGVNYQFQATVMWKSQDNSGQLSFNRLRRVLPPAGANSMQSLGNYGYGVQFRNETCPWNSRIRNSHTYSLTWIDDHCTKYSVVAQDAVEESETDEAYLCPTETKPKLTISDELLKSENAHQVVDFNKRARSIQQPAIKLNWTDTSRNGVEDNRLVFLDKDLSGHFRLTATDAVPLQWSAFCAMDKGYSHTSHWGTLGSSCAAEDGFCASQYFLFAAKPEVNFIGFGEQEDFHINHATNTLTANLTGEKCEFSSLSVDNHRLQVMVRNLDPNPGHSLSWVNYDFSVYDSTVVFGGGGEKESAYASSKVYIPFNEWADTEVIQDQGNANDGMVLVSNRRPYLNWVANLEGMPIKHRGCMIEKRDNAGALISTYRDCSPRSEGSGKWRPNSYLQSGVNIFRMKVVDWRDHWVVVKKSFIVDTRDPSLVFLDSHPALTYETSRTVRFRADEPSCTFRWRQVHTFDAYGNSTSPAWTWSSFDSSDDTWSQTLGDGYGNGTTEGTIELEELGLGRHVFEIVPVDSAGNEGNMKRLIWEVSARISHDTDNDKLIRHFVIRSSRAEEHCDEFAHCTKELKFTTSFEGGAGFVNVEIINDLPDWLRGETAALDERTFEHTLYLSVDKITEPSQLSHKLKLGHVDKACPTQGSFSDYCRTGGPTTIDGYYVNTTNLVRPANVLEFDVRLHTYEPPTLELEPDDFIRKLSGGIELDITKQSNASVLFKNTGDFPLRWKMVYSEGGSGAVDECGLDEQKEYIGTKPSWITLKDEDTGSLISSDVHTIAAKSSQAVMIDFDTQQLRTAHYRVALMMQTNDYDLSEDKVLDSDQGMSVSLSDYKYNGCSEDFDCVSASGTSCVTGQAWGYIRDIGGNTCSQTFSNSGMRILRNIGDQVVNEEMGFRFLAMEVEGMGANTLIFLPKKLNKAYVAAGTEVRQAVNLVSMVGASDAYFIYDTDTFEPQYDGLLEMPFWIYLSMTKLDINRDTSLVTYEREPFLDVDGNVDLSLLDTLVANGSYPDVIGAGGTNSQAQLQQFSSRLESWLAQVGDAKSRFNTPSHLVERTEIINTGGGTGMVFGIPVELDVNFRFFEKYTDLGRETVECLLSGQQREKCVQLYSMTFTVENSNDHYFGTWPEPLGICQTLQGLQACTDDTLRKYQRAKLSQMEVEVEFEPGLCSASESVLVVNTSDSESSSFTQQAKAGEEVELVIHTRDFLGNDRWPPEFCRSSLECTASCTYEKTLDDKEFDFDPIQFGGFVVLGEWSGFAAESSKPIFKPSSALSDFERQNLKYVCSGNPYGMGGMGMPERLEFFTRTSLEFYQGDQGLGGFEGVGGLGGGLGGLDTSGELNYIVFDRIDPLKTRCWDARALLSWIEDPMSWHIEGMRHFPLDKYLLLTPEDITMITNVAGGRKLPIDGIFDEEEFMQTEQITQWSYSEDNGDGTHSIKIPALKAGTYQLFAGEYARDFVKSTPMSLGVPTVLGSSANISNFYRSDDVEYDPLVSFLKYSVQNIQSYFFEVVASEIDLQSFLVLDVNPMQAIAGDEFCFNVQAQDRFENVVMTENGNSSDLQFYMLFKAVSYKNSTIKAYRATYTQSNGDDDVLGVTYETCFLLERAGHYELWLSEAGAFASQSLENIQTILSRGGDGQAKRLNKHVPQETIIAPSEVSEATSCIDEFGTSKWECGNQTATKTMLVGDPIKFMLHSYDEYGNPLQSSQNYTFIARLWANVTENSSSTGEEGDSTSTTGEEGDSTSTTGEEGDSTSTTGEEGDSTSTTGEEGDATSTTGKRVTPLQPPGKRVTPLQPPGKREVDAGNSCKLLVLLGRKKLQASWHIQAML